MYAQGGVLDEYCEFDQTSNFLLCLPCELVQRSILRRDFRADSQSWCTRRLLLTDGGAACRANAFHQHNWQ